jgi:hypothetical protein
MSLKLSLCIAWLLEMQKVLSGTQQWFSEDLNRKISGLKKLIISYSDLINTELCLDKKRFVIELQEQYESRKQPTHDDNIYICNKENKSRVPS